MYSPVHLAGSASWRHSVVNFLHNDKVLHFSSISWDCHVIGLFHSYLCVQVNILKTILVLADVFLVMMGVQVIDKMPISHQCHAWPSPSLTELSFAQQLQLSIAYEQLQFARDKSKVRFCSIACMILALVLALRETTVRVKLDRRGEAEQDTDLVLRV
jgi:hypothetical protein